MPSRHSPTACFSPFALDCACAKKRINAWVFAHKAEGTFELFAQIILRHGVKKAKVTRLIIAYAKNSRIDKYSRFGCDNVNVVDLKHIKIERKTIMWFID